MPTAQILGQIGAPRQQIALFSLNSAMLLLLPLPQRAFTSPLEAPVRTEVIRRDESASVRLL